MATSLSHRNSATIVNKQQQQRQNWQNVSIPRRRPSDKIVSGGGGSSSSSFSVGVSSASREVSGAVVSSLNLPTQSSSSSSEVPIRKSNHSHNSNSNQKRDKKHKQRREIVGDASTKGGDYYSTTNPPSQPQQQQQQHVHKYSSSSLSATTKNKQKVHSNISTSSSGFSSSSTNNVKKTQEGRVSSSSDKINSKVTSFSAPNKTVERRSSMESVKSTTSSASSGSGGFRRLKKFSSSSSSTKPKPSSSSDKQQQESSSFLPQQLQLVNKKSKNKEKSASTTTTATTLTAATILKHKKKKSRSLEDEDEDYGDDDDFPADEDNQEGVADIKSTKKKKKKKKRTTTNTSDCDDDRDSVDETFQQTQLRLWKAAQERHQQLKREEERKRLKKLQKKKVREQIQQERLQQKRLSLSSLDEEDPSQHDRDEQQQRRRDSLDSDNSNISDQGGSTSRGDQDVPKSNSSSSSHRSVTVVDDDEEARKARKKLKKLKKMKKLQQQQEAEEKGNISWSRNSISDSKESSSSSLSQPRRIDDHDHEYRHDANQTNRERTSGSMKMEGTRVKKLKKFDPNRVRVPADTTNMREDLPDESWKDKEMSMASESRDSIKEGKASRRQSYRIGDRVSVYWSEDEQYYDAKVVKKRKDKEHPMPYKLRYDDGDIEWINLHEHKVRKLIDRVAEDRSSDPTEDVAKVKGSEKMSSSSRGSEDLDTGIRAGRRRSIQIGDRVSVYWSEDEQYYAAKVVKKRKDKEHPMPYKLRYDDGDIEWIDLNQHKFKFLDMKKAKHISISEESGRREERETIKLKTLEKSSQSSEKEDRDVTKLKTKHREGDRVSHTERDCSESSIIAATEEGESQFAIGSSEGGMEEKAKKMKRLKKFRRLSESEESTTERDSIRASTCTSMEDCSTKEYNSRKTTTTSKSSSTSSLEASSNDSNNAKKMKRVSTIEDVNEMPKKKKMRVDDIPRVDNDDLQKEPSTPDRKQSTILSLDAAPLTPLSLGLADTVKTRVRSPAKARDELELLQAASFEKKKRKKNRDNTSRDFVEEVNDDPSLKKKRKKKKKQQLLFIDSSSSDGRSQEATNPKLKFQRWKEEELLYDADVEAAAEAASELRDRKHTTMIAETMSDVAWSETSSSTTVVTGKIKRKKKKQQRLKNLGADDIAMGSMKEESTPLEGADTEFRRNEQPLPLKKRMTMAAAAAESASWEKSAALSTTASKVSVSSSGATPEFATEASSISEFTHPLGSAALPPPPPPVSATNSFHRHASVPREIVSKPPSLPVTATSFELGVGVNASVIGPSVSSSEESDSDSSCDSDTDEEELFDWANKMFGTTAKPLDEEEQKAETCMTETNSNLTPELCEMERRRQKQEEARTLSVKEVNAILQEEQKGARVSSRRSRHWVRRSVRQPSRGLLNAPLCRSLLDKLRGNDVEMVVLKMKKYLSDPDTPSMVIDAALEALEENTNCESLYIQNFNVGMKDKQVLHLLKILQQPSCNIWCLNIGETYNVSEDTWEEFAEGLKRTKVTHMYASEHTITPELKDEIRDTIRWNRKKHNMHNDPKNLDVIIQCTHCWWNPINAKVLRPYLCRRGFESMLHDKEAQGLRGSMSEAPAV